MTILHWLSRNILITFLTPFIVLLIGSSLISTVFASVVLYVIVAILLLAPVVCFFIIPKVRQFYPEALQGSIVSIFILGIVSMLLYVLQTEWLLEAWILQAEKQSTKELLSSINIMVKILYIVLIGTTFALVIIVRASLSTLKSDLKKISYLKYNVINLILIFSVLVFANYIAMIKPISVDLTHIGRYSLSAPSKNIIRKIERPVRITAFYPYFHKAYRILQLMLVDLQATNSNISFQIIDAMREKNIASYKKISRNGYIVFESIDPEQLDLQLREKRKVIMFKGRNDINSLERELVSGVLQVSREAKNIYYTTGHRELSEQTSRKNSGFSNFFRELKKQNYTFKPLGIQQKFPPIIPKDADALMILSPKKDFIHIEKQAIKRYLFYDNGKVLLTLDREANVNFDFLLKPFQVRYNRGQVYSNDSLRHKKNMLLITQNKNHPALDSLKALDSKERFAIFPSTGSFEKIERDVTTKVPPYQLSFILKSSHRSWIDKIPNERHDTDKEKLKLFHVALAVQSHKPSKTPKLSKRLTPHSTMFKFLAFSDIDFLQNQYTMWPGSNLEIGINTTKWLVEDKVIMGLLPKKWGKDRLLLSPMQERVIFTILTFFWPLMILGTGVLYIRRRRAT